jgi:hypothetical protein
MLVFFASYYSQSKCTEGCQKELVFYGHMVLLRVKHYYKISLGSILVYIECGWCNFTTFLIRFSAVHKRMQLGSGSVKFSLTSTNYIEIDKAMVVAILPH